MLWLYIKELAGKDLDISVIVKFVIYGLPKLMPLVLPLTILLTSIMVFGNFAENYEFAAMKSTGISLQRAMAGLSVFIVLLAFSTFLFSNNVIPWGERKFLNLRKNLAKVKPSMAIAEGQFNEIESTPYNIKVEKKSGDREQFLENVVIHMKASDGKKNQTTIIAKTGEFVSREDSEVLKLILHDGNYYNDIPAKKLKDRKKHPFAKSTFETYVINIDLSDLNNVNIDDDSYSNKYNMLNLSDLDYTIDSLTVEHDKTMNQFGKLLYQRSNIIKIKKPVKELSDDDIQGIEALKKVSNTDSIAAFSEEKEITNDSIYTGNILDLFNTTKKSQFTNSAVGKVNSVHQLIENKKTTLKPRRDWYNKHIIAFHEKLALGFACIILFFVGAPLGALIRKGGLGLPMVIAILLFLTYHFIGIFALNSAKSGDFNPILAPWFSTLIMFPLSVFLTKKATADRGLFETEGLLEPLKKLFGIKKKNKKQDTSLFGSTSKEYETLNAYEDNKLKSIVKNHAQFGYKSIYKNTALSILNSRGISNQQLKFSGDFVDQEFEEALRLKNKYEEDSKLTLILYIIGAVSTLSGSILKNNKFPLIGNILFIIGISILVIYIFALIKAFISHSNFKKLTGEDSISTNVLFIVLGLPLYFIVYFFEKKKMSRDLNLILKEKSNEEKAATIKRNATIEKAQPTLKNYNDHSLFSIILYSVGAILLISYFIFKNNKLQSLEVASIQLSVVAFLLFIIYYAKSIFNLSSFYKQIKMKTPNLILLILGFPFYIFTYAFIKSKIKKDLQK